MIREGDTISLEHAYRVLNVPRDASPRVIKSSYRKLIQRWHPDRYRPESDAYTESTAMTKLLNESYARIKDAPFRDRAAGAPSSDAPHPSYKDGSGEPDPSGSSRNEYVPRDPNQEAAEFYRMVERARQAGARDDAARPFDWLGFLVRFVLGGLLGVLLSFRVMIYLSLQSPRIMYIGIVTTILGCAFASGFGGDAFWRALRPGGLWWWNRWD